MAATLHFQNCHAALSLALPQPEGERPVPRLDRFPPSLYLPDFVRAFRHHFFVLIVALLVLGGYSHQVLAKCHHISQEFAKQTPDGGKTHPEKRADDGCQCLCHKIFSNASGVPARVPVLSVVLQPLLLPAGEFPPDTEPQGIDYPPQLA